MVDYDKENGRWLLEEWINDQGHHHKQKIQLFLTTCCQQFYGSTTKLRPVEEGIKARLIAWGDPSIRVGFEKIFQNKIVYWPVALGHGDLHPGNMLLDENGRLVLCDFEKSTFRPVARDLRNIFLDYREYRTRVLQELEKLSTNGTNVINPASQMAICIALKSIGLERILEGNRRYIPNKLGNDPILVTSAILRKIAVNNFLIEQLLMGAMEGSAFSHDRLNDL